MPSVKFNKNVFEAFVGKKLSPEKLKDRISMLGTDLDSIDGNEIDVEIFPNRPDMLSLQGFARAFSSFIGHKTGMKKYSVKKSGEKVIIDKSVKDVRPFTACAIVKGLEFTDELIKEVIQMQEKLHVTYGRNRRKVAIGIYPMEKIRFPITFKALSPEEIIFQPLEADKEMTASEILEKHQTGKDYGHLLEDLDKYPVFVEADGKILSMPPIVNSYETGKVTERTKEVFIECSGNDFEVLKKCLNMIVTSLADIGGKIYFMELEYPDNIYTTPDLEPERMKVDISYINKRLGLELKEKEVKECLEKMGYGYEKGDALIPSYRADILHQIDLAEDIAIAYGYENFEPEIPKVATIAQEDKFEKFKNIVIDVLVGIGLLQLNTFHLTSASNQTKKMETDVDFVELGNSISEDYHVLQAWLIPKLMETYAHNKHHDYPQNVFTVAKTFKKNPDEETGVQEDVRLAVGVCSEEAGYTEAKQILDYVMRSLDLEYKIEETEHGSFISGRAGRVNIEKTKLAYIGEISPKVLENWGMLMPVACFEINLTELFKFKNDAVF